MFWKFEKPIIQSFFEDLELRGSSRFRSDGIDALDDRAEDHRYGGKTRLRKRAGDTKEEGAYRALRQR